MNAKEKNRLAGILLLAHGGLMGLMYLMAAIFMAAGLLANPDMPKIVIVVVTVFIGIFFAIFTLPQIIGGWKMYKEEPNAKNWGVAGAIVACISSILGIGAGVFALVTIFSEDGKRFYDSLAGGKYLNPANPVDEFKNQDYREQQPREPHSWR